MKNFIQRGRVISVVAPYALASGEGAKVGAIFGVAAGAAVSGASVELSREGVFDLAAITPDIGAVGAKMYWNDAERRATTSVNGNRLIGVLAQPKTGQDVTAQVLLDGAVR